MRVEPELTQHLKFRRLKAAVGDGAMEYLILLWTHCQQNQRGEFWPGADASYIEDTCYWTGPKGELFRALVECGKPLKLGFLVPEQGGVRIHDWELMNSQTVKNWRRNLEGRAFGKTTQCEPSANPRLNTGLPETTTHGQPTGNPRADTGISKVGQERVNLHPQESESDPQKKGFDAGSNDLKQRTHGHPNGYPSANPVRTQCEPSAQSSPLSPINLSELCDEAKRLVTVLNTLTGSRFNPPIAELDQIVARLQEVQGDVDGVEKMLRRQTALWKTDAKARNWLKPGTLFGTNFHDYYGLRDVPVSAPQNKKRPAADDRTDLLQSLSAARAELEQKPDDPTLAQRVSELEAATA